MTLNPRKSPAVFSALWACCALLLCGNLRIWVVSPDRWASLKQIAIAPSAPPPASDWWSGLPAASQRRDTLWYFLTARLPSEVDEAKGGVRSAYVTFWPYRYVVLLALGVVTLGGGLGRLVYWRLWQWRAVTRGAR